LICLFVSIMPIKYFSDGLLLLPKLTLIMGLIYLPIVYEGYLSANRLGFFGIGPIPPSRMLLYFLTISVFYGNVQRGYGWMLFLVIGMCLWFNQSRQALIIFITFFFMFMVI
jgi:hypothetical protein